MHLFLEVCGKVQKKYLKVVKGSFLRRTAKSHASAKPHKTL